MIKMSQKHKNFISETVSYSKLFIELTILILAYLIYSLCKILLKFVPKKLSKRPLQFAQNSYRYLAKKLDRPKNHSISRLNLIEISVGNLSSKKSRTFVTIGGMAVGIGSIVFLVSIGYGLQELVVSRVARLEELKQTDVIAQPNSELKINDEALSNFNNLDEIEQVLPLISVVGKVTYKEAVSDMAVYGVTSQYLEKSAIQPARGKLFQSEDLAKIIFEPEFGISKIEVDLGQVAGVTVEKAKYRTTIKEVEVEIEPEAWYRVREEPSTTGKVLGYTKRDVGKLTGDEIWGSSFSGASEGTAGEDETGTTLGKWIKTKVALWQQDDDGVYQPMTDENGSQIQQEGYIAQLGMRVTPKTQFQPAGSVLGISDDTDNDEQVAQVANSGIEWIEIASESGSLTEDQVQRISLGKDSQKQAVVNRAVLNVLGIDESQALGQKFETSFIVMGKDLGQPGEKVESTPSEYEIVGIIPGDKVPLFYVPFLDLRSLGIVNYSQVKLVVDNQQTLPLARQKIEAMGFLTRSVVDTVDQIESIFATTRIILGLLGMGALLVASLGMFNTLTVSLLERTREVGLMKALGMKSYEVKELFLIESLLMGLLGGAMGLLLGLVAGKLLSFALSIFSVAKGVGIIDITLIPIGFVLLILFLAVVVGIITGLYPARRARHISALNALRYE